VNQTIHTLNLYSIFFFIFFCAFLFLNIFFLPLDSLFSLKSHPGNSIGVEGIKILSETLKVNQTIHTLDLDVLSLHLFVFFILNIFFFPLYSLSLKSHPDNNIDAKWRRKSMI